MAFPMASRVIDRFHMQRLAVYAVQENRIRHRWDAINAETDARENAKLDGRKYVAERLENGDTLEESLPRVVMRCLSLLRSGLPPSGNVP